MIWFTVSYAFSIYGRNPLQICFVFEAFINYKLISKLEKLDTNPFLRTVQECKKRITTFGPAFPVINQRGILWFNSPK